MSTASTKATAPTAAAIQNTAEAASAIIAAYASATGMGRFWTSSPRRRIWVGSGKPSYATQVPSATRWVSTATPTADPTVPPRLRKNETEAVAMPRLRGSTEDWATATRTGETSPMPRPRTVSTAIV